jgi:hypothetical protein
MAEQVSSRQSTETPAPEREPEKPVSPWAAGFAWFAGVVMVIVGAFQAIQGVAAIVKDEFYVVTPNYAFDIDVTAWGWIHLVLGVLVFVAGFCVFTGQVWARAVGIIFAVLNAVAQFLFLPHYPVWSIVMIALDIAVIWALAVYGRSAATRSGFGSY